MTETDSGWSKKTQNMKSSFHSFHHSNNFWELMRQQGPWRKGYLFFDVSPSAPNIGITHIRHLINVDDLKFCQYSVNQTKSDQSTQNSPTLNVYLNVIRIISTAYLQPINKQFTITFFFNTKNLWATKILSFTSLVVINNVRSWWRNFMSLIVESKKLRSV